MRGQRTEPCDFLSKPAALSPLALKLGKNRHIHVACPLGPLSPSPPFGVFWSPPEALKRVLDAVCGPRGGMSDEDPARRVSATTHRLRKSPVTGPGSIS